MEKTCVTGRGERHDREYKNKHNATHKSKDNQHKTRDIHNCTPNNYKINDFIGYPLEDRWDYTYDDAVKS
jgi:hypothetical protein